MEANTPLLVRMLLRVSSSRQLDTDGDLTVQRNIVAAYIKEHRDWTLDPVKPEYYEGGISGYKNSVDDRQALQAILTDAGNREFQILVCYKDDRLGRREDEIPQYIKKLAALGVLVFTVKDGCITPQNHTDSLINFIRYWHAEGASRDTSQRVKDAAKENVRLGKNQGGRAPYGYRLEYSGTFNKHQRALKKKVINPKQAEVVRYIYDLAGTCGYGYSRITSLLNGDERLRALAPDGSAWKAGTVRDILRNPIYTGYLAYNRREKVNGSFITLDPGKWILSEKCCTDIQIIAPSLWSEVQKLREKRRNAMAGQSRQTAAVPDGGALSLLDVLYCGSCGRKMANGSKYNYWITKDGIKHSSRTGYYRCQTKHQGGLCSGKSFWRADTVEARVSAFITDCLTALQDNGALLDRLAKEDHRRRQITACRDRDLKNKVDSLNKDIETLEEMIPRALRGESTFSAAQLSKLLTKCTEKKRVWEEEIKKNAEETAARNTVKVQTGGTSAEDAGFPAVPVPGPVSWADTFIHGSVPEKRAVINRLIERIDINDKEIRIRMRIGLDRLLSRNPAYKVVSK